MNNIIQSPRRCQEEKEINSFFKSVPGFDVVISSDTDRNNIFYKDFTRFVFDYCTRVSNDKNFPWHKNNDPIKLCRIHGITKLSKNQLSIIQFLHKDYFRRGKPCYLKMNNLIRQADLKTDQRSVRRSLRELSDRGIIHKIMFKHKGKYFDRFYLVPSNKFILDNPKRNCPTPPGQFVCAKE
jgi:hypothetical protein